MDLYNKTALELKKMLDLGEVSSTEIVASLLERIEKVDPKINAYLTVNSEDAIEQAKEADIKIKNGEKLKLLGIPVAVKDNMCTKGIKTTCASKILENFVPYYDAEVVSKLKKQGAVILGKTNMDEFAMGSSTENSAFFATKNPWDTERVPGGSSGGSSAGVAANEAIIALGSDTGGSIRQPASFCGTVALKPTYGLVSRYGLVAFASSLDQIGPICKDVADTALVLEVISGYDEKDSTSAHLPSKDYVSSLNEQKLDNFTVGIAAEFMGEGLRSDVKDAILSAIKILENEGAKIVEVNLPHAQYALSAYYIIAPSEASSNLARFDGARYGIRKDAINAEEMFKKSRMEGFGDEVKRRIMIGTYALSAGYYDAYYLRAQKVRTLIKRDFDSAFSKCDFIIGPACPTTAFKIGEKKDDPLEMYLADIYTVLANLAGIPALVIPCAFTGGLPVGLQFLSKPFSESKLLNAGNIAFNLFKEKLPKLGF